MTPPTEALDLALPRAGRRTADFVTLTKPRVVLMITVTTAIGYYVGLREAIDYLRLFFTLAGTALAAGGTLALNQFLERDVDRRMERTRLRPLPDGRLQPAEALIFGVAITTAGLLVLTAAVSALSALVTGVTVALYLFAYTPLKLRSSLCMVVGAIPGALPPVTGWVSARGEFGVGAWVLFSILFLWQLPHTLAIARLYRDDYARAGIQVLPVVDPDGTSTERQIVAGCLALLAVGLLPTLIGLAGPLYFFGALVLGLGLFTCGVLQALSRSASAARRLLFASLLYLPMVLFLMALDKLD